MTDPDDIPRQAPQSPSSTGRFDTARLKPIVEEQRTRLHEKVDEEVPIRTRRVRKGDIFRFAGLVAFFAIMVLAVALAWPYLSGLFEEGGYEAVVEGVQSAGIVGVFMLLGLQFLQVVVAVIPGEVVQIAAGMLYGPWLGALIIWAGCIISSAFIFQLVHKLGAPFVQDMVSTKYLDKLREFERSGKLDVTVFVLFLIPGLPKDVFTYLVPLTSMRMGSFLLLSNIARIPGIVVSTYAADGLMSGDIVQSVALFAALAVIAVVGLVNRERIMGFVDRHFHRAER